MEGPVVELVSSQNNAFAFPEVWVGSTLDQMLDQLVVFFLNSLHQC